MFQSLAQVFSSSGVAYSLPVEPASQAVNVSNAANKFNASTPNPPNPAKPTFEQKAFQLSLSPEAQKMLKSECT